ncbi:IS3 family transposase [Streptomyces sp. NPDC056831]|uniref:IS3 family transposase n=1 Tax=Streptomyces sp. NPDC056831 TaxID=3345954 RepID=UPI0036BD4540
MFGIKRMCRVLEVSRSGYYRWIAGAEARAEQQFEEDALVEEIREIHTEHRGNYGALRVHAELRGLGHTVNRKRVARLMRKHGIVGRHLRTIPDRLAPPVADLVQQDFTAGTLDEKSKPSTSNYYRFRKPVLRRPVESGQFSAIRQEHSGAGDRGHRRLRFVGDIRPDEEQGEGFRSDG